MKPEEIKALRERLGLTRESFAERLGTSYDTVRSWELGRREPSPMAAKFLALIAKTSRKRKRPA